MVNIELLKEHIQESGMTMTSIAKKTGILRETLYNRLNGVGQFSAIEIVALTKCLHLSKSERDDMFLRDEVT